MATLALTAIAMLAFAGNSVLCRMALGHGLIDAATFTTIRALSGAVVLGVIALLRRRRLSFSPADWIPATALFAYMACFSFAYLSLSAGTGALILFGAVQTTMILFALHSGERLTLLSWAGFCLAVAGLVWLVSPGLTAPDPVGALLMAGAGVAWGAYSLIGRKQGDPALRTASNFVLAVPMALILSLALLGRVEWTWPGASLAAASGAVTSGLGYVVWYAALSRLSATQAAGVQLTVPVIAAIGGALLLSEALTTRLMLSSVAVLGGVWLVVAQRAATGARSGNR